MSDVIVIGAGIAGAATAWALQRAGLRVTVLEKEHPCSGGSLAAGAFLSPKISKPSAYKTWLNRSLAYALEHYTTHFPQLLHKKGLWKLPLDSEDAARLQSYEPYIDDIRWQKRGTGYFFPDAGIIEPKALIEALLAHSEVVQHAEVLSLSREGDIWQASTRNGHYRARYIVLATGSASDLIPLPYLRRKTIGGYRYDVRFDGQEEIRCNIHKDLSVSAYLEEEKKTIVGATHIRQRTDLDKAALEDSYGLMTGVAQFVAMPNARILRHYSGYRSFPYDYFPILGPLVDAQRTLRHYPFIMQGARVPASRYIYYPDLYIHTALGSRGFVFAPYNARLLAEAIVQDKPIDAHLLPATRFRKWARKQQK